MSKNTVKRLLKLRCDPKYKRGTYTSKIDKYKEHIRIWFLEAEYNFIGTRIFTELKKIGYTGSIGPVYRFLKTLKQEKNKISNKATVRVETAMGDQAQFDWSPYKIIIDNEIKEVYCFTMILSASRLKAGLFSLSCDSEAIYEAIQELFSDLGGITKELIIDNAKSLVLENETGVEPKYNINALRLAAYLGTELNACNPYRARTKGKIEKPYQHIEEQFVKGNSFNSMTELNKSFKEFLTTWCKRTHGTTKRIPQEAHKEELNCLLPLPQKRFINSPLTARKVSLDSLVNVNGRKYSVPVEYVDKQVQYRFVYGYRLEIYNTSMDLISVHEINMKSEHINMFEEHYYPISSKVPKSIPEIKRQFTATFKSGEKYLEVASKVLDQPSFHARQFLKLKELYTTESLDIILSHCIENSVYSIDDIKKVIKEKYMEIILKKSDNSINSAICNDSLVRDLSYYEGGGQF